MSPGRAGVLIVLLSVAAAGLVGLVSRAPQSLREAQTPPGAADPSNAAEFPDQHVERARNFQRARYVGFGAALLLDIAVLLIIAAGPFARLANRLEGLSGGWVVHAALGAVVLTIVMVVASLPLSFVRGYAHLHAWGLSTQTAAGWLGDVLRSLGVASVIATVGAVAFFGLVRWQVRWWPLWGWVAFTVLTLLLTFLWPVLIAPLFNRFTPVDDPGLEQRITAVAADAGVAVDEVLVADASRRTTTENAYVAGLGGTRRVVLFDNLLDKGDQEETVFVVAHELGHEAEGHVLKGVLLSSIGLLLGFGALWWLTRSTGALAWVGAKSLRDVRVLPLLALFVALLTAVSLPAQNAVSRSFERAADRIALRLTDDPRTAVALYRRLALSNLADPSPSRAAVLLFYTHPPIGDRIDAALHAARKRSAP